MKPVLPLLLLSFIVLPLTHASATYPNEPPGLSRIIEMDGSVVPTAGGTASSNMKPVPGYTGYWWMNPNPNPRYTVAQDPTAPQSGPDVLQIKLPTGQKAGTSPGRFGGWSQPSGTASLQNAQYGTVYVSVWVKINGSDYEAQASSTKQFYVTYAEGTNAAGNEGLFRMTGPGTNKVVPATGLAFMQYGAQLAQAGLSNPNVIPASGGQVMTAGVWHHWEGLLEINSAPGAADGTLRWWVDGQLVVNRANMIYTTASFQNQFYGWYYYPDWGGTGGCPNPDANGDCFKTRDDYFLLDHIYVSGVLKGSAPAVPVCGNSVVEGNETCDLGNGNGLCPALCSASCTTNSCTPAPKPGDLNGDGRVDLVDVQRVLTVFGQSGVTTGEDVNGDAQINIYDLIMLARNWG